MNKLIGKTLTAIDGMEDGSDEVLFTCADGTRFRMWHEQDCCESVRLVDVAGDVADLLGCPVLGAEENSREATPDEDRESGTWTFYNMRTVKGAVALRWLGESNGFYSEGVTFEEIKAKP